VTKDWIFSPKNNGMHASRSTIGVTFQSLWFPFLCWICVLTYWTGCLDGKACIWDYEMHGSDK